MFAAYGGVLAIVFEAEQARAVAALQGAGLTAALVLWCNLEAARVRGYSLLSIAGFLVVVGLLEAGVRSLPLAEGWYYSFELQQGWLEQQGVQGYDETPLSNEITRLLLLERGVHTDYPYTGYPVAYGPKRSQRVVSFGGSSTGGAFTNERLDEFYPALAGQLLGPSVEVVNQGVGGWTTFHILQYARQHLDKLQPDVVTLYAGVNDCGEGLPMSVPELDRLYKERRWAIQLAGPLRRLLLYRALKTALFELRSGTAISAVSEEEAEQIHRDFIALARGQGARVLLLSEGTTLPNPTCAWRRAELMADLAAEDQGVAFVDTRAMLRQAGPGMFIDFMHLSDDGHRMLAHTMAAALREQGWLDGGSVGAPSLGMEPASGLSGPP